MDFINDEEKIQDYFKLTKDEFLESYSYLTEEDYNATTKALEKLGNISRIDILKCYSKPNIIFYAIQIVIYAQDPKNNI